MKIKACLILSIVLSFGTKAQDTLQLERKDTFQFDIGESLYSMLHSMEYFEFEIPECPYNRKTALKDIEKDSMSIVIHIGITGGGNMNKRLSEAFQKTYNVEFVYLGCLRYWDMETEDTHGYNELIFNHLRSVYGYSVDNDYKLIWTDN